MTMTQRRLLAPLSCSVLLSGLAWMPAPAEAYWHGYRCWGGCWARPVVIDPTVVAPVVVAPPMEVAPPVEVVPATAPPVVVAPASARLCSAGANVSLRTGPNQNFAVVASLSPGIPLSVQRNQVNELGQDWSLVNAGGYEGFIPSGHVCYGN
jgi:hypothetical protein